MTVPAVEVPYNTVLYARSLFEHLEAPVLMFNVPPDDDGVRNLDIDVHLNQELTQTISSLMASLRFNRRTFSTRSGYHGLGVIASMNDHFFHAVGRKLRGHAVQLLRTNEGIIRQKFPGCFRSHAELA